MNKYRIQGKGEIRLSDSDFKGQGGQASIYAQGSCAYKIYTDSRSVIPAAKISELSVLTLPSILTPQEMVLDELGNPAGYRMRYVDKAYLLGQVFPASFRTRCRFTGDNALHLVRTLQNGVSHIHSKGVLIVDLNEMNFLVSPDFKELFFIDVDSYQTPSFPATAIMDSVRDRHSSFFCRDTDWFSFAIVSFQIFAGLHPYRGTYPPFLGSVGKSQMLDERMKSNISVMHRGVSLPPTCLPIDGIPAAYRAWYKAVFEEGLRRPPPTEPVDSITLRIVRQPDIDGESPFEISQVMQFDGDVVDHFEGVTMTTESIYVGARGYHLRGRRARFVSTGVPSHPIAIFLDGDRVRFVDISTTIELEGEVTADELMVSGASAYVRRGPDLLGLEFVQLAARTIVQAKVVGSVLRNATHLFDGVVFQNLIGAWYGSFFPQPSACYQTRIKELDGYRILDAKCIGAVLIVIAVKENSYDRLVFRFKSDFSGYDVRASRNVVFAEINFTVLENGVCLHLADGELELFHRSPGHSDLKLIAASELGNVKLFHQGMQALFARGNGLFKFKLKAAI